MQPQVVDRESFGSSTVSGSFAISSEASDQVHLVTILRDRLYTDKVRAVIREYCCNAWDANVEAGRGDRAIRVVLPTRLNPSLIIRDYGYGLSQDDVFRVYTQYGASTKRGDNKQNGMLGIGSKSGFAYADTFTVTSFFGGKRSVYVATLDETEMGRMSLLYSEDSAEETGIEISVPVQEEDMSEFAETAGEVLFWFTPVPDIANGKVIDPFGADNVIHRNAAGQVHSTGGWWARMGTVAYVLNVAQLGLTDGFVVRMMHKYGGIMEFSLGEITVSANREEVEYRKPTKEAAARRAMELFVDTAREIVEGIANAPTTWDKRIRYAAAVRDFGHTLPGLQALAADGMLKEERLQFPWHRNPNVQRPASIGQMLMLSTHRSSYRRRQLPPDRFAVHEVLVRAEEHILIVDSDEEFVEDGSRSTKRRQLHRFQHTVDKSGWGTPVWIGGQECIIVMPAKGHSAAAARADIESSLAQMGCDGLPIRLLSEAGYEYIPLPVAERAASVYNAAYRKCVFELDWPNFDPYRRRKRSANWKAMSGDPVAGSPYVILSDFEMLGTSESQVRNRIQLLHVVLDLDVSPIIYGFKTTVKRPVTDAEVQALGLVPIGDWIASRAAAGMAARQDLRDVLAAISLSNDYALGTVSRLAKHGLLCDELRELATADALRVQFGRMQDYRTRREQLLEVAEMAGLSVDRDWHPIVEAVTKRYNIFVPFVTCVTAGNELAWVDVLCFLDRQTEAKESTT